MPATIQLLEHCKSNHTWIISEARLSICLQTDGFSFSIIDNKYELCEMGRFKIAMDGGISNIVKAIRESFAILHITMFRFLSTTVLLPSQKQTWLPLKVYDPNQDRECLYLSSGISIAEVLCKDILPDMDMVSLFAYPMETVSALKIVIPGAKFISTQQRLTECAYSITMEGTQTLLLNHHDDIVDMAFFRNSDFLGSSAHKIDHFSDFIYYLLFTAKHMSLNPSVADIYLSGDAFNEEEMKTIRTFFKNVKVLSNHSDVHIPETFKGKDLSPYFLLLQ